MRKASLRASFRRWAADQLDGIMVAAIRCGRGVRNGFDQDAPAQILAFKMTRPPGDKKNIQSPMDLSRVPSLLTSRANRAPVGRATARDALRAITACGREVGVSLPS